MNGATDRASEDEAASHKFALKTDVVRFEGILKASLASLEGVLKEGLVRLDSARKEDIANLKEDIAKRETLLAWRLFAALASGIIVILAVVGLIQAFV